MSDELVGTLQARGQERIVLRVGSMATLSRNFQLQFLRPLFGRDDVELLVRSGGFADLLRGLEAHRLDVVLANTVPPRGAATPWVTQALAEQAVSLVGHADQAVGLRSLDDLLRAEPLVLPAADTGIRIAFDALTDRLGVAPRIAAEVDDMAILRLLARERVGLAVVPTIVVRDELETGELVEIARLPEIAEHFHAITLSRRFPNPLLGIAGA